MSAYLLGNLIFTAGWVALFILRPRTRRLQLFGSLLLLPFALLDIWFRPYYWNPPLLFKAIEPLSLETVVYCFTAGGIAAVLGSYFMDQNFTPRFNRTKIFYFFLASFFLFYGFTVFSDLPAMNNLNLPFLAIWLGLLLLNPKTNYKSFYPGLILAAFTIIAINLARIFYPNFVTEYWNLPQLWPTFLSTPTEEIFFAGVLGALWTLLPNYLSKDTNENLSY